MSERWRGQSEATGMQALPAKGAKENLVGRFHVSERWREQSEATRVQALPAKGAKENYVGVGMALDLIRDIMAKRLMDYPVEIRIDGLEAAKIMPLVEETMVEALNEIRMVLADEEKSDFDCVEEIVLVLEGLGVDCGVRHDF
ncbi:hypothetical protein LJC20_02970 [Eubacteriales bacterium OttesenSCG-928-M02]|nr:hypothetical protein [Eubacteriales bacterium OttesenSCG-928-M02]